MRDLKDHKEKKEPEDKMELMVWPVRMEPLVSMARMVQMVCREGRVNPEMLEPRERLVNPELTETKDPKEKEETLDKRGLLVSRDRKDNKEMTERRVKEDLRGFVSQMIIIRVTAIPTPSFDTRKLNWSPTALRIMSLSGLDIL